MVAIFSLEEETSFPLYRRAGGRRISSSAFIRWRPFGYYQAMVPYSQQSRQAMVDLKLGFQSELLEVILGLFSAYYFLTTKKGITWLQIWYHSLLWGDSIRMAPT